MLFRVFEHYDDNLCQRDYDNECFICFEYKTETDMKPINLQNQRLYFNNCLCKGSVHNDCLKIWFDKNKTCPICRIKVIENNKETIIIHNYIPWAIYIYIYIKKITLRFVRVLSVILFMYTLVEFYFMVIKTRYRPYTDYTYIPIPIITYQYINETTNELIKETPTFHS